MLMRRITLLTNPDKCNLHCPLCFLNQRGRAFGMGEMSLDVMQAAIEKYGNEVGGDGSLVLKEVIPSTMGEPLLYTYFDVLLQLCRDKEIPLNLTTNGTFPGKWGSEEGLQQLLESCSDIKVSALASESFDNWKRNVENLMLLRRKLLENRGGALRRLASVSLQVTLHKRNLMAIPELIAWAAAIGIERIKWNPVVFLSAAPSVLRDKYALDQERICELKRYIRSFSFMTPEIRHEGSLFFEKAIEDPVVGNPQNQCSFKDEIWILPDGTEQDCPNPERRFGDRNAVGAMCENCPMHQ